MRVKERAVASGIHFLCSLVIFSAFFFTIIFHWFPEPFFTASGGLQGITLVAAVDLVLGPLLTFIVFNSSKRRTLLALDFSIIVCVQLLALIWGMYTVYMQRPIALVFWENSFYTVPYNELNQFYADDTRLHLLRDNPRQMIYAVKPPIENDQARKEILERVARQIPPHQQLEIYRPFDEYFSEALPFNLDIEEIISVNTDMREQLNTFIREHGGNRSQYFYLPLRSRYRNIVLIFDQQGSSIGYLQAPYL
jgi:hypothetical protein